MSADADPPPDHPIPSSLELSTSRSDVIPPRRLSRLFFDAERPFYLLDEHARVCFVNQALVDTLKTDESAFYGLDCNRVLVSDDHRHPVIAGLLAIPEQARASAVSFSPLGQQVYRLNHGRVA